MVEAFIKPKNNEGRRLGNFVIRYLIEPPLIYLSDTEDSLPNQEHKDPQPQAPEPEDPPEPKQRRKHRVGIFPTLPGQQTAPETVEEPPIKINFSDLLTRAYLVTYGFDGFDHTTSEIVFAENNAENRRLSDKYQKQDFSIWVLIASFLGLPTRPSRAAADAKPVTELGIVQLARNFIGGWEPMFEKGQLVWTEKKVWQWILLFPIKFPIILLLKIISVPVKFALNVLKLFTEWLPAIAANVFTVWFLNAIDKTRHITAKKKTNPFNKGVKVVLMFILTLTLGFLNYTFRILTLLGRAATSPEKSARMAYAACSEYAIKGRTEEETETFRKIFGIFGLLVSALISTAIWTLTLPLAIGAFITYVPLYLPTAFQWLASVAQLPIVTKSLAILNSALGPVGTALVNYASPLLSTVSTYLGVQISTSALILGTAIGALAAPIMAIVSRLADEFSNAWAGWFRAGDGPFTAFSAWVKRQTTPKPKGISKLIEVPDTGFQEFELSIGVITPAILVEKEPGKYVWELPALEPSYAAKLLAKQNWKGVDTGAKAAASTEQAGQKTDIELTGLSGSTSSTHRPSNMDVLDIDPSEVNTLGDDYIAGFGFPDSSVDMADFIKALAYQKLTEI